MANTTEHFVSKDNLDAILTKIETKLQNRYTKSQADSAIANAISGISHFDYAVVDPLPAQGTKGTIYLVPNNGTNSNLYDEYIWIVIEEAGELVGHFEPLGSREVNVTNKLENTDIKVTTSLNKTNDASGNGFTLDVNVDGTTIVKDETTGALKATGGGGGSSSGGGVVVQTTAPTDTNVLWIDTSNGDSKGIPRYYINNTWTPCKATWG